MTAQNSQELPIMTSQERLDAYNLIIGGCHHIWSKNKIQEEKAQRALEDLLPLAYKDPFFLAHLTSYVFKNSKAKDLKTFLAYISSLSDADGQSFSPNSKYKKPNLRYVGWAALHQLDPKLADRVLLLATRKFSVQGLLNESTHFPTSLRSAFEKYLKYREANPEILEGIRKAGFKTTLRRMGRKMHYDFSDEARQILDWPRKGQKFEKRAPIFDGLDDLEVAQKIRTEKLPYITTLGELSRINRKVSPVIAVAMLEQATGNQAVIMRSTFEDAGILNDKQVMDLYESKIKEAKTTLDRATTISKNASEEVKKVMKDARAEARKEELGDMGKIFVHLDFSGSMQQVREYAAQRGAILAEMVQNPRENFAWGWFSDRGFRLDLPDEFVEDAFAAKLYGQGDFGGTDCVALYAEARRFGADIDVYITDQGHMAGDIRTRVERFHKDNPSIKKPRACVIVHFNNSFGGSSVDGALKSAYESLGIPVAILKPEAMTESALVVEAVKTAMLGPISVIDDIMNTKLLELPEYYYAV
jgi:hypothetical protein